MRPPPPPASEAELLQRALALAGLSAGQLAGMLGCPMGDDPVRGKGRVGDLLELALGATAGPLDQPDFPHLGVELKTIPLDPLGRVKESTFVCAMDLAAADREEWETSRVRRKLARVLWFPVAAAPGRSPASRRLGRALLWSPSAAQEELISGDWQQLTGRIAVGGIEEITAHLGRVLQVRPKARDASVRVDVLTPGGDLVPAVPRGFYLRARFTEAVIWELSEGAQDG